MTVRVYDSDAVDLIAVTIPITEGKGDPFVTITPEGPAFEDSISVDGDVTRYQTNEQRVTIEVQLEGSSPHNQQLAAVLAADRSSTSGAGLGGFLLKDGNGATLIATDRAWLTQCSSLSFGKNRPPVTWTLRAVIPPLAMLPGGN